ncbi:MAG: hypothetical protein Q9P01_01190 [Anaerolineae bacterium]|nr:hypothetical protein [Anaerolineae bacterium]
MRVALSHNSKRVPRMYLVTTRNANSGVTIPNWREQVEEDGCLK